MMNLKTFHYFLYGIVKQSNEVWYPKASKQTSFSYPIFHGFLQNMHQNIRKGSYFMNSSSSGRFEVLCRCLILFNYESRISQQAKIVKMARLLDFLTLSEVNDNENN
jgi:hypothetical protein